MKKRLFCLPSSFVLAGLTLFSSLRTIRAELPNDNAVLTILRNRIDTEKRSIGIVVGLVDEHGSRVVSYGHTDAEGKNIVNQKTIFEIGSITKVFTAVLLELAVEHGEMNLSDPVAKYLPTNVKVPVRNGRQITLLDLATHRSGLPTVPDNMKPSNPANPYADYTWEQMLDFLAGFALTRDVGSEFEYSNLGFGLLGQTLARRAGTDYESLVAKRVCQPLSMPDTCVTLTPELRARLALPYDEALAPAQNWDLPAFAGAGALRSDVDDLLKFVSANLGFTKSDLTPAIMATHQIQNHADSEFVDIALAWHVIKKHEPAIISHAGGTGGYASFIGFDEKQRCGVVVLSNTASDVYDIGLHLLNGAYPLSQPPKARHAISIKSEVGRKYVGRYQLEPNVILTFSQEGDHYYLEATGQSKNEVFPETPADFFFKGLDAQISFIADPAGKVTALILHQGGEQRAPRLP